MDDFTKDTNVIKENPATNGAILSKFDNFNFIQNNQKVQTNYVSIIEVTIPSHSPEHPPVVFVLDGKPARSLWYLYQCKDGLTRAEALDRHFILSLTQHVHYFRNELGLKILTERIPPTRYANYHLITPISIRVLSQGGK